MDNMVGSHLSHALDSVGVPVGILVFLKPLVVRGEVEAWIGRSVELAICVPVPSQEVSGGVVAGGGSVGRFCWGVCPLAPAVIIILVLRLIM